MSNRLVNNVSAKKRAQEIGSSAAAGAVKGVSSGVTKDPTDVIGSLTDNATVDASPKGGVAAVAKGTDSQNAMDQLNSYYRRQAAKEKSDLAYADYLTDGKVSQDIKYGNYLTNGRYSGYNSYADYLASIGQTPQDSQKTRDASVAKANADYARALAGYGQTGEQLARSGLSNTGYSDASNNAAYAAKQNAILQADATKAATDQSNRLGYAQYLQAYDAQQQNKMLTVLEYTTQAGMTEEQAKAYAKAVGFDDTIAESIGKAQASYTAATSGTATKATDLYNTLVSNENFAYDPATKNSLRQQLLNSGYDEATVDDVLGRLDKSYTTAQGDTYELFKKALTENTTLEQIGATIEGWDKMTDSEKAISYIQAVAKSTSITDSQREAIFKAQIDSDFSKDSIDDVLNRLSIFSEAGLNKSVYDNIVKYVESKMGQVSVSNYKESKTRNRFSLKIDGNEISGFIVSKNVPAEWKSDSAMASIKGATNGTMRAEKGKLYIMRDGQWFEVEKFFTADYTSEQQKQLYEVVYNRVENQGVGSGSGSESIDDLLSNAKKKEEIWKQIKGSSGGR